MDKQKLYEELEKKWHQEGDRRRVTKAGITYVVEDASKPVVFKELNNPMNVVKPAVKVEKEVKVEPSKPAFIKPELPNVIPGDKTK
jgi:hypothetical protein